MCSTTKTKISRPKCRRFEIGNSSGIIFEVSDIGVGLPEGKCGWGKAM
jgi:hypothetical protein